MHCINSCRFILIKKLILIKRFAFWYGSIVAPIPTVAMLNSSSENSIGFLHNTVPRFNLARIELEYDLNVMRCFNLSLAQCQAPCCVYISQQNPTQVDMNNIGKSAIVMLIVPRTMLGNCSLNKLNLTACTQSRLGNLLSNKNDAISDAGIAIEREICIA